MDSLSAADRLLLLLVLLPYTSLVFAGVHLGNQSRVFEVPISGNSSMGTAVLQLGDPPQTVLLLPDTGSSDTWMFCGNFTTPEIVNFSGHYDIAASSTFAPVYCSSPVCPDREECSSPADLCPFNAAYVDGTLVRGFWASETVTLSSAAGEEVKFRNFTVGCGYPVSGDIETFNGVLGLSPDERSFAGYISSELGGAAMAHYVPREESSGFIFFGDADTFGAEREGMNYVDLLAGGAYPSSTFFVGVSSIFVGGERVLIPDWVWGFDPKTNSGGVILDTGTPLTYLVGEAYAGVLSHYGDYFRREGSLAWEGEEGLCFNAMDYEPESFPAMAIEFDGGARLTPFPENLVYEPEEGTWCLTVKAANRSEGSIIGSYFQRGFYWEYDPDRLRVGYREGP